MKTAMQELLDELEYIFSMYLNFNPNDLNSINNTIKEALEKEKEQLEEARLNGYGEGYLEGIYDAENK